MTALTVSEAFDRDNDGQAMQYGAYQMGWESGRAALNCELLATTAASGKTPDTGRHFCGHNPWMAFYLVADALQHRAMNGGWVFVPDGGFHPVWFNTEFTPSAILAHPLTAGRSGRLLP